MSDLHKKMMLKLEEMNRRFEELDKLITDQDVINNTAMYTAYIKEHGSLLRIAEKYRCLVKIIEQKKETEIIVNDKESDDEFRDLAEDELKVLSNNEDAAYEEIKQLFLTENKESMKGVIAEIRAGTGGDEAALFAADLFRMYAKYAETQGWKTEIFDCSETDIGGYKEIVFSIEGNGVYRKLRYESGTHRVQRVPATETSGRIHTSAATVAILPEIESVEIDINPTDLEIDTFRSSGPGGQKVNKTSSAVRIVHKPTGLVVKCMDEKSQHKNKAKAMRVLRSRLYEHIESKKHNERAAARKSQIGSGERSEKIRTYNFPQNRVTDHRMYLDLFDLDNIVKGSLQELLDRTMAHYADVEFERLMGSI